MSTGGVVTPRPAATIMVVRDAPEDAAGDAAADAGDGAGALQVLLLRRNLKTEFGGGAYVFPGGAVDPADGGAEAEQLCRGRTDQEASRLLGLPSGGSAYWVAALRECFEEAGLLLAYDEPGGGEAALLHVQDRQRADRLESQRREVNTGRRSLLQVCADEGLRLAVDRVHYFAHWITPAGAPRRYDTRFFVAQAPPGQEALHDSAETIDDVWITPSGALRRHREGEIELILPTIRNLQAIGRFRTCRDLLRAAAAASGRVPAIEPRVVADGNGVRILLPGDSGYEEVVAEAVAGPGAGAGPGGAAGSGAGTYDFDAAIRAISRAANREDGPGGS